MAYTPYSHFQVGAALLTEKRAGFDRGCNIENAAYTPTNCAERTAFFKAVSEGERSFTAIAVVGGPEGASEFDWCAPCGVCRQVMKEFCHEDAFQIILARSVKEYKVYTLAELLPMDSDRIICSRNADCLIKLVCRCQRPAHCNLTVSLI